MVSCARCRSFCSFAIARISQIAPDPKPAEDLSEEEKVKMCREIKAKTLVEKKTVINLLGAYAVAVKHYLRGEDGIYYE